MNESFPVHDFSCIFEEDFDEHKIVGRLGLRGFLILDEQATTAWHLYKTYETNSRFLLDLEHSLASNLIDKEQFTGLKRLSELFDRFMSEPSIYLLPQGEDNLPSYHRENYCIQIADQVCSLAIEDVNLIPLIQSMLHLTICRCTGAAKEILISGNNPWLISFRNESPVIAYTKDEVLVNLLDMLYQIASRPIDRLITLHASGLISPEGCPVLLIGRGGSGKSTLAALLESKGYYLLNDDVVPISRSNELIEIGLPLILKEGSWPIVNAANSVVYQSPIVCRMGKKIRFITKQSRPKSACISAPLILFIHFDTNVSFRIEPVSPIQSFKAILEAEPVLPNLTGTKLKQLIAWVSSSQSYTMHYSSTEMAFSFISSEVAKL
jgi:hypothetical protein